MAELKSYVYWDYFYAFKLSLGQNCFFCIVKPHFTNLQYLWKVVCDQAVGPPCVDVMSPSSPGMLIDNLV